MEVTNEVLPTTGERMEQLMQPGPGGPIHMVNLVKFKEHAEYDDGRETDLSGRQAYEIYGNAINKLIGEYGGEVTYIGDVTFLALGQVEELWDEISMVMFPSRAVLWKLWMSSEWQEMAVHRAAGLSGQINIETVPVPLG